MIVIRRYKDSGEWVKTRYPRVDISEDVSGLDSNIEYFGITENKPVYDSETQYLAQSDITFTTNDYQGYSHIKEAVQNYTIEEIPPIETIIL